MHIGFLSLESPYDPKRGGGIAAYLRALIPGLVGAGHRVTVLANSRAAKVETRFDGTVRVVPVRLPSLHWYLSKFPLASKIGVGPLREIEWSAGFYRAARNAFDDDPVDVLESCEAGALLLARWPIGPIIVRLHGSDHSFCKHSGDILDFAKKSERRLQLSAMRSAAAITAPSQFQACDAAREMGWPQERISVLPNPIAPAMLAAAQSGRLIESSPSVLYVGRLAKVKGIEPLLGAAELVRAQLPLTRFLMVGPWQMAAEPAELGLTMDTSTNCAGLCWTGHVNWDELIDFYRRAMVFVMPSYFESFGISVVEAMAFGLPICATTGGALPELVKDGETGILVPPGDEKALSEALIRLLRDPGLCRKMGEAGRIRVLEHFTTDKVASMTLSVYATVMRSWVRCVGVRS